MSWVGTVVEFINLTLPAYTLYCIIWAIILIVNKWKVRNVLKRKWNYRCEHSPGCPDKEE